MSLFRSDVMGYYHLVMPRENAWEILNSLGDLKTLQFVDLNAGDLAFNRPYSNHIKRCEDMEAKVAFLRKQMKRFNKEIVPCEDPNLFLAHHRDFIKARNRAAHTYIEEAETDLDERVAQLTTQIDTYDKIIEKNSRLKEYKKVLEKTRKYIGDNVSIRNSGDGPAQDLNIFVNNSRDLRFNYLAGVINTEDKERFRRILFRVTRGMTWTALEDIETDPKEEQADKNLAPDTKVNKTVFLIVYQGGAYDMMRGKLNKVCDSFSASKYAIPEDARNFTEKVKEIEEGLRDSKEILNNTRKHIENVLDFYSNGRSEEAEYSYIDDVLLFIAKEKAIYHNLNMLKLQNTIYHGSVWCPVAAASTVQTTLLNLKRENAGVAGCEFTDAPFPPGVNPPTFFRLNDVSAPYQEIVNTYGVPRYREINPALFAIATFPFMFGVMFGDIGHGGLLFIFGIYLTLKKDEIAKSKGLMAGLLPGRYVFLFQGFFAFYCGWIYNDFMAIPFDIFGTCYEEVEGSHYLQRIPGCTYPFGIDPGWGHTVNELTYLNSFKMKLAIVIGVVHMTFGIFLKGLNTVYFGQWTEFFFEFIPQLVFMTLTFGYMVALIFIKWSLPWQESLDTKYAPSIIAIFIKMALQPGTYPEDATPLYGGNDSGYISNLQFEFLIIAMICVPLILLPKPLMKFFSASHAQPQRPAPEIQQRLLANEESAPLNPEKKAAHSEKKEGHGSDDHDFGEVFVHQVIETIEFVLGCISNTASYLRLWALSLAHSQLAKVFFENTIGSAIISGNFFMVNCLKVV